MTRKYIIAADDSIKGFDEEIEKLEREWGAEEIEPCEDAVSRKKIFQTFGELLGVWGRRALMEMPPVTPKAEWIPCSERLPEDNIHVLCQFTLNGMGECYLAHGVFHVVGGLVMTCNEVIAWMPLPQPYTESEEAE